ncbi:hypothetical protein DEGR_04470 [Deinococcus grandis]|nr:hypothetical protein DEGR_04470 [Deinococcus grandis]
MKSSPRNPTGTPSAAPTCWATCRPRRTCPSRTSASPPRPETHPGPRTRPAGRESPPQDARATPGRPGDIRAHPVYEDIRTRFSGRVREIGKNRNAPPAPDTLGADLPEEDDE